MIAAIELRTRTANGFFTTIGPVTSFPLRIRYTPELVGTVITYQHRAVFQHKQADGPAPHFRRVFTLHPPLKEVVVATSRRPVLEWYPDDLIACAFCSVPGAVQSDERVAPVFLREHITVVEHQTQHS